MSRYRYRRSYRSDDELKINLSYDRTESVKKLIKKGDLAMAENFVIKMLSDPQLLRDLAPSPLFKYISTVKFDHNVKTAQVNLKDHVVKVSPKFFVNYINDVRDLLFLIMHEREHVVNNLYFGGSEKAFVWTLRYQRLKKVKLNERILEDAYINYNLVRAFSKVRDISSKKKYVPLSVRFYKKIALLKGALNKRDKAYIESMWGERALQVVENLTKSYVPLYDTFVGAFVPFENPSKGFFRASDENSKRTSEDKNSESEGENMNESDDGGDEDNVNESDENEDMNESDEDNMGDSDEDNMGESDDGGDEDNMDESDDGGDEDNMNENDEDSYIGDESNGGLLEYEDLTEGSQDYIFSRNSNSHSRSKNSLIQVDKTGNDDDLSKLTTVLDSFGNMVINRIVVYNRNDNDARKGKSFDVAYSMFSKVISDLQLYGRTPFIPDKLSRRDMFIMSASGIPTVWDTKYTPEAPKFVVYYDVSGSMRSYYRLVMSIKKVMAPYITKAYQFSGFLADDSEVPEGYFDTDSSTSFHDVIENITINNYPNVIIVSDFVDHLTQSSLLMIERMKGFVQTLILVKIGGHIHPSQDAFSPFLDLNPIVYKISDTD